MLEVFLISKYPTEEAIPNYLSSLKLALKLAMHIILHVPFFFFTRFFIMNFLFLLVNYVAPISTPETEKVCPNSYVSFTE